MEIMDAYKQDGTLAGCDLICFDTGYGSQISFFKNGTGFLGETRGSLYVSKNKGKSFIRLTEPSDYDYSMFDFINSEESYSIYNRRELIHTTNGGKTWEHINLNFVGGIRIYEGTFVIEIQDVKGKKVSEFNLCIGCINYIMLK